MSNHQKNLAFDEVQIIDISNRIVGKALQPQAFADYVLDCVDDQASQDLLALRTANRFTLPGISKAIRGRGKGRRWSRAECHRRVGEIPCWRCGRPASEMKTNDTQTRRRLRVGP